MPNARIAHHRTATRRCAPRELPGALRDIWRECLVDAPQADVARALNCNLVLAVAAADEAAGRDALARLHARTPCRAFLFVVDDGSGTGHHDAEVAAVVRTRGPERDIVLEEVVVRLPRQRLASLPGLVRPLLVNDLPNHLYWQLDWPHDQVFARALHDLCEHVIVDTSRAAEPRSAVQRVQALQQRGHRITDLSWLRTKPWRRALAEAFERLPAGPALAEPAHLHDLPCHGSVHCRPENLAPALLLADWLQRRLGAALEFVVGDAIAIERVRLCTGDHEIQVELAGHELHVGVAIGDRRHEPFRHPAQRSSEGELLAAAVDVH